VLKPQGARLQNSYTEH